MNNPTVGFLEGKETLKITLSPNEFIKDDLQPVNVLLKENELWYKVLKYLSNLDTTIAHVTNPLLIQEAKDEEMLTIRKSFVKLMNDGFIHRHNSFTSINGYKQTLSNTEISAMITIKGLQFIESSNVRENRDATIYNLSGNNIAIGSNISQNYSEVNKQLTERKANIATWVFKTVGGLLLSLFTAYLVFRFGWN